MKRARGIDISHWQITFNPRGNIDFVIAKASELEADPCFQDFYPSMLSVPIRGAYHYFRTGYDPIKQAETFLAQVEGKDLHFLAVDYESRNNVLDEAGANNLLLCLLWLVEKQPLPVLIYTGPYIYRDNLAVWNEAFDSFPLWLARWKYSDEAVADPTKSLAGDDLERSWSIWQYTSTGDGELFGVRSVCVDLDVYNGTVEEMKSRFIMEDEMKKWYASKTIWFSVLFILVQVAAVFGYADWVPGDDLSYFVNIGVGVLVAILRALTSQGIEP